MALFCSKCGSIPKIMELICITFDNLLFPDSHQIILEIIDDNPIVSLVFDLKLCLLFFKNRFNNIIQNPMPIIIKFLLGLFYVK